MSLVSNFGWLDMTSLVSFGEAFFDYFPLVISVFFC